MSAHRHDDGAILPVVVFTGQGPRSRNDYTAEAEAAGWLRWGRVCEGVDVLVAGDGASALRQRQAVKLGISILTYEQWSKVVETGEL